MSYVSQFSQERCEVGVCLLFMDGELNEAWAHCGPCSIVELPSPSLPQNNILSHIIN